MNGSEQRVCKNCRKEFAIEPDDFEFYKKIDVPSPTFCPQCRMMRRFAWRNERTLFHNTCKATGKSIITGFHPDSGITVFDRDYWWSDKWDALSFGTEYDFSKPFFTQFRQLLEKVPMPSVFNARTTNTPYSNYTGEFKDGYMLSASWGGENVAYGARVSSVKDSMDLFAVVNCDLCYELVTSEKNHNTHFSQDSENCTDSWFLYGCKGCSNCFGCTNLRGKSYYIFNEPYPKEEYQKRIKEFDLGTHSSLQKAKQKFEELKRDAIRKYANIINCQNVTGDHLSNVANSKECFDTFGGVKDCKYLINALDMNNCYDGYGVGARCELQYEAFDSGIQGMKQCFVGTVYGGANIFYSLNCHGCSNLFGCIGLRQKEYCIFNKQYSKEEFADLREKIVGHMAHMPYVDSKGREYLYGEFFPIELSPFAYNETVAQEYFPRTAETAMLHGYLWREAEKGNYAITNQANDLPDDIKDVIDEILKEIVACAGCGKAYRFIPQELQFLKRVNIPLPRYCFDCRHRKRFLQVNPPKLWHRTCMCGGGVGDYKNITEHFHASGPCHHEFETTYLPERTEIIYCEQCYNAEVV
jgi:hypothetical protein